MVNKAGWIGLAFAFLSAPLYGQSPNADCNGAAPVLPPELAAWGKRSPLDAAADKNGLAAASVHEGRAVGAALRPTGDVHYLTQPGKPGGPVSYGGMFRLTVGEAATYRVALDSAAWIDVVSGTKAVLSSAHGHGPKCSGIRKVVDFQLKPGRYVLQIAASGTPDLSFLIARVP